MKVFNLIVIQTHFYNAISRSIHGVFFVYYIIYFCKMNDVILPITIFFTVYNHREKSTYSFSTYSSRRVLRFSSTKLTVHGPIR